MTAWDIIRRLQDKPDFFAECTDETILSNEREYSEALKKINFDDIAGYYGRDDYGRDDYGVEGMFPSEVFPSDLAKIDFPNVDYDRIERKVSGSGIDVLAWYISFHWDPPEKWGIYIPMSSIYYLARNFDPNVETSKFQHLINRAFKVLVMHECFHYAVDMAAAVLESADSFRRNIYAPYSLDRRSPEESVANAWTLSKHLSPYHQQVKNFMDHQPPPYTQFRDFGGLAGLTDGLRRIADRLVTGAGGDVEPIEYIFNLDDKVLKKSRIPIYILPDDAVPEDSPYFLGFAPRFDPNCIIKSDRFEKSLIKLSKKFPVAEKMLDKALNTFTHGSSTGGLRFKKMKGHKNKYEFRLNQGLRVVASYLTSPSKEGCTSEFLLEDIGKHKIL